MKQMPEEEKNRIDREIELEIKITIVAILVMLIGLMLVIEC